jgi:hypothetical protein
MSPRASLPGAAELFRSTGSGGPSISAVPDLAPTSNEIPSRDAVLPDAAQERQPTAQASTAPAAVSPPAPMSDLSTPPRRAAVRQTSRRVRAAADQAPTGRERHEEKITVYCSAEELIALETARLSLRAEHGMAVDRGRIVREALAVVLADLAAKGDASILVRRLRDA